LIETVDPMLPLNIRALDAQKQELQTRYQAERIESLVQAQITLEQLKSVDADLDRARERATELIVRSPADGVFVVPAPQDLPDRFLKQGEQIGYVLTSATATARVLVPQESVDMVRKNTEGVRVKLAERLMDTLPATIRRELPGASDRLPSMALAQAGGGKVALDPNQGDVPRTLQTHFEFELELPAVRPAGSADASTFVSSIRRKPSPHRCTGRCVSYSSNASRSDAPGRRGFPRRGLPRTHGNTRRLCGSPDRQRRLLPAHLSEARTARPVTPGG
jgi:putative peptide zinc metalloprotease protein